MVGYIHTKSAPPSSGRMLWLCIPVTLPYFFRDSPLSPWQYRSHNCLPGMWTWIYVCLCVMICKCVLGIELFWGLIYYQKWKRVANYTNKVTHSQVVCIMYNRLPVGWGECEFNVSVYKVSVTGTVMVPVAQKISSRWLLTDCLGS